MDLIITILPVVTKDLPISPRFTPYNFLSRCKFSILTTRQPMVEFYLLTFPRFPLRKKEHKSYFGKNRTHDFRTSRCAAYLLDHSGDVYILLIEYPDFGDTNHLPSPAVRCDEGVNIFSGYVYGSVCMYACMVITYSRVWINRVRLPILLVVS